MREDRLQLFLQLLPLLPTLSLLQVMASVLQLVMSFGIYCEHPTMFRSVLDILKKVHYCLTTPFVFRRWRERLTTLHQIRDVSIWLINLYC